MTDLPSLPTQFSNMPTSTPIPPIQIAVPLFNLPIATVCEANWEYTQPIPTATVIHSTR